MNYIFENEWRRYEKLLRDYVSRINWIWANLSESWLWDQAWGKNLGLMKREFAHEKAKSEKKYDHTEVWEM